MLCTGYKGRRLPGKNTVCCWGQFVCAKDYQGGIAVCHRQPGTKGGLFFGFDCPYLVTHVSLAIPIVGAILLVFIIGSLLQTFLMDPGIIPRPTGPEILETERLYYLDNPDERPDSTPDGSTETKTAWFMEVEVRGRKFKLNYCRTCKMYRQPRATHCSRCDNCVEQFDHHCALVGNCVGKRNYRYFYSFITLTSILSCYVIGCNITVIVLRSKDTSVMDALKTSIASVIESVICLFSLTTVGNLTCYHTGLVARGITTNEDLKEVFNPKRVRNSLNPYHHGSFTSNFVYMCCVPRTSSLLSSSCYVMEDERVNVSDIRTNVSPSVNDMDLESK